MPVVCALRAVVFVDPEFRGSSGATPKTKFPDLLSWTPNAGSSASARTASMFVVVVDPQIQGVLRTEDGKHEPAAVVVDPKFRGSSGDIRIKI